MTRNEFFNEISNILESVNPGDAHTTSDEQKINILKEFLPKANLRIGQIINRHNEAGDSYNKIIGFLINWWFDGKGYSIFPEDIHIICDRVKRYNESYSSLHKELEFYHGEIWSLNELLIWRERGDIIEDTPEAEAEYNEARKNAVKEHDCCFVDTMLTW